MSTSLDHANTVLVANKTTQLSTAAVDALALDVEEAAADSDVVSVDSDPSSQDPTLVADELGRLAKIVGSQSQIATR
jgi:hypothetical protein